MFDVRCSASCYGWKRFEACRDGSFCEVGKNNVLINPAQMMSMRLSQSPLECFCPPCTGLYKAPQHTDSYKTVVHAAPTVLTAALGPLAPDSTITSITYAQHNHRKRLSMCMHVGRQEQGQGGGEADQAHQDPAGGVGGFV